MTILCAWLIIYRHLLSRLKGTMRHLAYYRISSSDPSVEDQRQALSGLRGVPAFDLQFMDVGPSGALAAKQRPGFQALIEYLREGDTLHVYAIDRLGRDASEIQQTVREFLARGVAVNVRGLGLIARGEGELIPAVLAQVADMERQRIRERTQAGRQTAKQALAATGKTHNGKNSLGRPRAVDPYAVRAWRLVNQASLSRTAAHFAVSLATVKRALVASR